MSKSKSIFEEAQQAIQGWSQEAAKTARQVGKEVKQTVMEAKDEILSPNDPESKEYYENIRAFESEINRSSCPKVIRHAILDLTGDIKETLRHHNLSEIPQYVTAYCEKINELPVTDAVKVAACHLAGAILGLAASVLVPFASSLALGKALYKSAEASSSNTLAKCMYAVAGGFVGFLAPIALALVTIPLSVVAGTYMVSQTNYVKDKMQQEAEEPSFSDKRSHGMFG